MMSRIALRLVVCSLAFVCLVISVASAQAADTSHLVQSARINQSSSAAKSNSSQASQPGFIHRAFSATAAAVKGIWSRIRGAGMTTQVAAASAMAAGTTTVQVNGGGWFRLSTPPPVPGGTGGSEANFGLSAKMTGSRVQGHFNYQNRTTGLRADGPV